MQFFIKQNSTLPVLKVEIIRDSNVSFRDIYDGLTASTLTFSMKNVSNDRYVILNDLANIEILKDEYNNIDKIFIYYQFSKKQTKKIGEFLGEFNLNYMGQTLSLPIEKKIYINILESITNPDLCCKPNRDKISIVPNLSQPPTPSPTTTPTQTITPTVTPTLTPTITITPTTTPTQTITPTVTPTLTPTITITPTTTPTQTITPTVTPTLTPTKTITPTSTPSVTPPVSKPVASPLPPPFTLTPTPTPSGKIGLFMRCVSVVKDFFMQCVSSVVDINVSPTPSVTPTVTPTNDCILDHYVTPVAPLLTNTPTPTPTVTPSNSQCILDHYVTPVAPLLTNTPTVTPTVTSTPDNTPTSSPTVTPSVTTSQTPTPTVTPTLSPPQQNLLVDNLGNYIITNDDNYIII